MRRPCLDCGRLITLRVGRVRRCPSCERAMQTRRNRDPERVALYGGSWPAESRAIRAAQPWCSVCGTTRNLTVDHPTRSVLCRSHHAHLENERRRVA